MTMLNQVVETERLIIRPMSETDSEQIAVLGNDRDVFKYIPEISTPFDVGTWMKAILENPENYVRHVVVEKHTSNIAGFVLSNRRPNMDLQLGFWFGKKYWGKGYASEVVGALLVFLRSLGVRSSIYAAVHPNNIASQKVIKKFGFEMLKDTKKDSSVYHDMVDYSLML